MAVWSGSCAVWSRLTTAGRRWCGGRNLHHRSARLDHRSDAVDQPSGWGERPGGGADPPGEPVASARGPSEQGRERPGSTAGVCDFPGGGTDGPIGRGDAQRGGGESRRGTAERGARPAQARIAAVDTDGGAVGQKKSGHTRSGVERSNGAEERPSDYSVVLSVAKDKRLSSTQGAAQPDHACPSLRSGRQRKRAAETRGPSGSWR